LIWRRFGWDSRDLFWVTVLLGLFLACAIQPRCAHAAEGIGVIEIGSSPRPGQILIMGTSTSTSTSTTTSLSWAACPDHVHRLGPQDVLPLPAHTPAWPWWQIPVGVVGGGAVVWWASRGRRKLAAPAGCAFCGATTHEASDHQEARREVDRMLERIQ
jgi:hypothetical protein